MIIDRVRQSAGSARGGSDDAVSVCTRQSFSGWIFPRCVACASAAPDNPRLLKRDFRRTTNQGAIMKRAWIFLAIFPVVTGCGKDADGENPESGVSGSYRWLSGKLIPNEFGLPDGAWSDSTIRECISKCSADRHCAGFSVEKKFGDAWEAGCEGTLCEEKTECHAKGDYGSSAFWLPGDTSIRVPAVDAGSNAWIENWGTVLKK